MITTQLFSDVCSMCIRTLRNSLELFLLHKSLPESIVRKFYPCSLTIGSVLRGENPLPRHRKKSEWLQGLIEKITGRSI